MSDDDNVNPAGEPDNQPPKSEPEGSKDSSELERLKKENASLSKKLGETSHEAREYRLKIREMKEAGEAEVNTKLEEQKKFKELYEKKDKELLEFRSRMETQAITHALETEALSQGIKERSLVKLVERSTANIIYDADNMTVHGAKEAIAGLKESHPFIIGEDKPPPKNPEVKSPNFEKATGKVDYSEMKNWTQQQIREYFRKNRGKEKNPIGRVRRNMG